MAKELLGNGLDVSVPLDTGPRVATADGLPRALQRHCGTGFSSVSNLSCLPAYAAHPFVAINKKILGGVRVSMRTVSQASWPSGSVRTNHKLPVLGLFLSRCPTTILRAVVPIRINTVETSSKRSLSHIGEEVLEPHPVKANPNTLGLVVQVVRTIGIKTARLHCLPGVIGRTSLTSSVMSMNDRLVRHRDLQRLGAMGQAASTALPFYFTQGVPA